MITLHPSLTPPPPPPPRHVISSMAGLATICGCRS